MFIYLGPKFDKGDFSLAVIVLIICSSFPVLELVLKILTERNQRIDTNTNRSFNPKKKYL